MRSISRLLSSRKLTWGLFVVYFLILSWLILGKMQPNWDWLLCLLDGHSGMRSLNLIPFAAPRIINGQPDYSEVWQNLLVFLPFGLYMGLLLPKHHLLLRLLPAFLTSLLFELIQLFSGIGAADVTDLLSNTVGALLGLIAIAVFNKILKSRTLPVANLLASFCTLLLLALISTLILANI